MNAIQKNTAGIFYNRMPAVKKPVTISCAKSSRIIKKKIKAGICPPHI